ncbi:hypothetical protein QVD17_22282 [Tagetes erecta]|uniref:Uncharacterized protein n=1 Tax=Tagetes erecta TaxID=13708 RepID=A0AAD8KCU3_TARER|nr:hypothetical protein QVD17_22282 [Tagetes erecta]
MVGVAMKELDVKEMMVTWEILMVGVDAELLEKQKNGTTWMKTGRGVSRWWRIHSPSKTPLTIKRTRGGVVVEVCGGAIDGDGSCAMERRWRWH